MSLGKVIALSFIIEIGRGFRAGLRTFKQNLKLKRQETVERLTIVRAGTSL